MPPTNPELRRWLYMQDMQSRLGRMIFDPEGSDYDYKSAIHGGMAPATTGPNVGHWGSVRESTADERSKWGLPLESYLVLKGRKHPTWDLAVGGERQRGFKVIKLGDRYWSVPENFK